MKVDMVADKVHMVADMKVGMVAYMKVDMVADQGSRIKDQDQDQDQGSGSSLSCGTHNASSCAECPQVSPLRSARLMFLFLMKMCSEFHVCRFSYFQGHGGSWCKV